MMHTKACTCAHALETKYRKRVSGLLLDQLEDENDNLRAVLEWSLRKADCGEASLPLARVAAADTQLEAGASYWDAAESRYIGFVVSSAVTSLSDAEFAAARPTHETILGKGLIGYCL